MRLEAETITFIRLAFLSGLNVVVTITAMAIASNWAHG